MNRPGYNKLVLKLTFPIVIIVALVFAVLIPYMLRINTSIMEKNMDEQVLHLSSSVRNYINEELADLQKGLKLAIEMPPVEKALGENNRDELAKLLLSVKTGMGLDFIAVVDHEKKPSLFFHNQDISFKSLSGMKIVNEGLGGLHLSSLQILNNKFYIIGVVSGNILGRPGIIIAGRALNEPAKMGVEKALSRYAVVLYNTEGEVVMAQSTSHWAQMKVPPEILRQVTVQRKSFTRKVAHDSKTVHIANYGPLVFNDELKAVYSVHIPAVDILSGRNKVIRTILVFMFSGIVLMVLTGYITSRWVTGRIGNLLKGTREISKGKLGYRLSEISNDEIGELTASFNDMSGSLQESHEWWKHTFDSMNDAISIHDMDCNIIKANASLGKLLGVSVKELIGTKCHSVFHASKLSPDNCPLKKCALSGKTEEIELYHPDMKLWLSISASPILKSGKATHIIHVARDISGRKHAEELIQRQLNRLNVLHSIEKAVNSSLDLHDTLEHLVNEVTVQLGINAATVLLLNRKTQMLEYVVSKGFRSDALKYTKLKLGESNAGHAATERRIISIPDLKQMPDGFTRSEHFENEDFVSYFAVPLIARGMVKGVLELFQRSSLDAETEWLNFLDTIADQAAIAIDNSALFDDLQHSRNELVQAYDCTIEGWSHALDMRDKETEGHSRRVTELTLFMAQELGIKDAELVHIKWGALLHDIGKMGVPDRILLKPDKLTDEEWEIMKRHTDFAYDMLRKIDYLQPSIDIPYCHHEKWDGTGYPRGLKGKEIPLAARIFAVVDVWDALSSDRPYRPAWPKERVIEHISSLAGTHFDPEVAEVFLRMQKSGSGYFKEKQGTESFLFRSPDIA